LPHPEHVPRSRGGAAAEAARATRRGRGLDRVGLRVRGRQGGVRRRRRSRPLSLREQRLAVPAHVVDLAHDRQ
jgi:hypothetical protein